MAKDLRKALVDILNDQEASSQDDIRKALLKRGIKTTQSTISRTLGAVGAVKTRDGNNEIVYTLPPRSRLPQNLVVNMVHGIDGNGHTIVIRTRIGTANTVAIFIDENKPDSVLGTIAGDDTIFVAPASIKDYDKALEDLKELILGI